MPWAFLDENGEILYTLPATVHPDQRHIGGQARIRFLRGYGSETWYVAQDGLREPRELNIIGSLQTDRDEVGTQALIDDFVSAAKAAFALAHVAHDGVIAETLPLLGALPITTVPDGVDGSVVRVTLPLIPGGEWEPVTDPGPGPGPGPDPTVARYWRVRTSDAPGVYSSMAEIMFVDNLTAPEIISDNPANAIGGPQSYDSEGNAFDDDPDTMWESDAAPIKWVGYDFGEPVKINHVGMIASAWFDEALMVWAVDTSNDAIEWTEIASFTETEPWSELEVRMRDL